MVQSNLNLVDHPAPFIRVRARIERKAENHFRIRVEHPKHRLSWLEWYLDQDGEWLD